jgi:Uma2 family endonuclease
MNVSIAPRRTRAAEGLPRRRFTIPEVEAMVAAGILDGDERVELIGGELVPMSPEGSRHELMKEAINRRWCRVAPEAIGLIPETTFRLSEDTYLEPDFVLYPSEAGLIGLSPTNALLVLEIAESSRRYDMGRKAKLYASFGVRELWVVDAARLTTRVFSTPSRKGYLDTSDFAADEQIVPRFAPLEFALALSELKLGVFRPEYPDTEIRAKSVSENRNPC